MLGSLGLDSFRARADNTVGLMHWPHAAASIGGPELTGTSLSRPPPSEQLDLLPSTAVGPVKRNPSRRRSPTAKYCARTYRSNAWRHAAWRHSRAPIVSPMDLGPIMCWAIHNRRVDEAARVRSGFMVKTFAMVVVDGSGAIRMRYLPTKRWCTAFRFGPVLRVHLSDALI